MTTARLPDPRATDVRDLLDHAHFWTVPFRCLAFTDDCGPSIAGPSTSRRRSGVATLVLLVTSRHVIMSLLHVGCAG